jgi:hypothetical protein
MNKITLSISLAVAAVALAGCSSGGGSLSASQALSKLENAGVSCASTSDFGTFDSGKGFVCNDFADSYTGFHMSFESSPANFQEALQKYCGQANIDTMEKQALTGENWIATIDSSSVVTFSDLKGALGGDLATLKEICSR